MKKALKILLVVVAVALCAGTALYFFAAPRKVENLDTQVGLVLVNGEQYYFDENGVQMYGWQSVDGKLYYFDPVTGCAIRGWFTDMDGTLYYFGFDGVAMTGEQTIEGKLYHFGSDGKLLVDNITEEFTWQVLDGNYYCLDAEGEYLTGLQMVRGILYYFGEDGVRQTGWQSIAGNQYYFDPQSGRGAKGWLTLEGATYYFGENGFALTGKHTIEGKEYSFDSEGRYVVPAQSSPAPNKQPVQPPPVETQEPAPVVPDETIPTPVGDYQLTQKEGKTYWQDSSGNIFKGLGNVGGALRLCHPETGEMLTGRQSYEGRWYQFDAASGAALTGWLADPNDANVRYYYSAQGPALTGLQTIDSNLYNFNNNTGAQITGFVMADDGKLYYFAGAAGEALTGWHIIREEPKAVRLLMAMSLNDEEEGKRYYFGDDCAALTGLQQIPDSNGGTGWYAFSDNGTQLKGWQQYGGKLYKFDGNNGRALTSTWASHENGSVYLSADGSSCTSVQEIDGKLYYFGTTGFKQSGWATVDGKRYCFDEADGVAVANEWRESAEGWCYLGADHIAFTGLKPVDDALYLFDENGVRQTGWKTSNGKLYYLAEDGKAQLGWQYNDKLTYYICDAGHAVTGLQTIGGKSYYFNITTAVREGGWKNINGVQYLFDGADQQAITGEYKVGSSYYLFGEDGAALTGVQERDGAYYYYNKSGVRQSGWQDHNGYHYYFDEETAKAKTGWFPDNITGGIYYFGSNGRAYTGTQNIDGIDYQFETSGRLKPTAEGADGSWVTTDGKTYFVDAEGNFVTGLKFVDTALYYFDAYGVQQSGLLNLNNKLYYFDPENDCKAHAEWLTYMLGEDDPGKIYYFGPDGSAYKGIKDIDGAWYCFNSTTAELMYGEVTQDGGRYYFDKANGGKAHTGWYPAKGNDGARYYDPATACATVGMVEIGSELFLFDDAGVRQGGWHRDDNGRLYCFDGTNNSAIKGEYTTADQKTYYFTADGAAAVGLVRLAEGGPLYYFDTEGVRQTGWQRPSDGKLYLFGADGAAVTGEYKDEDTGYTYYFHLEGAFALTGTHEMGGRTYIFDNDGRLISKEATYGHDWKWEDTTLYYMNSAGEFYTGLKEVDGYLYYFNDDGSVRAGWVDVEDGDYIRKYYFGKSERTTYEDFRAVVGWFIDASGDRYYFSHELGYAVTGEQNINGTDYVFSDEGVLGEEYDLPIYNEWVPRDDGMTYYDGTGALAAGLTLIEGKLYYFSEDNLLQHEWHTIDGYHYYFGAAEGDGAAYKGWQQVESRWYRFDDNGRQLLEWQYRLGTDNVTYTHYYDKETGRSPDGFGLVNGAYRYFYPDGHMAVGWATIVVNDVEQEYYFYQNGERASGVVKIEDKLCSFNSEGQRITGWNTAQNGRRYYFEDETALTGWNQLEDGRWYRFHETEAHQLLDWQYRPAEDGTTHTFFYGNDGALPPVGVSNVRGIERYFFEDGHMAVGWQIFDEWLYYFARNGEIATGTTTVEGIEYAFDEEGRLQAGWVGEAATGRHYFGLGGAARGWELIEDKWYYFDENTGKQLTGWQKRMDEKGATLLHYFAPETGAVPAADWMPIGDYQYYFLEAGNAAQGWHDIGEGRYYFFPQNGRMAAGGVHVIEGKAYSFGNDGKLQMGWNVDDKGNRYYFTEDGPLLGWHTLAEDGKTYHFDEKDGRQLTGWQTRSLNGKPAYYFFYENGGTLESGWNTQVDNITRYVLADGQMAQGWQTIGNSRYYFTATELGVPATGWRELEGRWYRFDNTGKQMTGWQERETKEGYLAQYYYFADGSLPAVGWNERIENTRRYIMDSGEMARGWRSIGQYRYYFNERGVPNTGTQTIDGALCAFDATGRYIAPPVITSVNYDTGGNDPKQVTINAQANALHTNKTLLYSFDDGRTWQSANTASMAAGTVINAGTLQVKDAAGVITSYGTAITLPAKAQGTLHGIDVSAHQGYINWAAVAASGKVDFAIIRSLCWSRDVGYYIIDPYFDYNVRTAKAYGIKVGTYLYSYAFSQSEMLEEISFFMNSAEVRNLYRDGLYFDLPVYIDYEDPLITANTGHLSIGARTDIVRYGMNLIDQLSRSRYGRLMQAGFYTYYYFAKNAIDGAALQREGYEFWLARYASAHGWSPSPPIWQYSSSAQIPGIGTNVDVNYLYKDYGFGHSSGGTGTSTPTPPAGVHNLTVTNQYGQRVTEPANEILAKIVAYEVKGFQNVEVYKAQAVAAQSWILYQQATGVPAPQVGLGTPDSSIYTAVNQVVKELLRYNGGYALTPYYAYNNGTTNDARYWNAANNFPYLVTVSSPYDAQVKGSYSQSVPREVLRERLTAVYGYDVTAGWAPENWIQITGRNAGGYATSLNVCGRTPGVEYFYLNILPYTSGGKRIYPVGSPSFTVHYDGSNFVFTTTGYGHCIGMSQTGAYGMAREGYNYKQILSHYYPGTTLGSL